MRIRTVKPEFFSDPMICSLDPMSRLTFLGLWIMADDEGRLLDTPKTIAGELFPFDESVTSKMMDGILEHFAKLGRILRYEVDGIRLIFIVRWKKHQHINHPTKSKLAEPPNVDIDAGEDVFREVFANDSLTSPKNSVQEVGSRKEEVGSRKEEVGSETPPRKKRASLIPDEFPITEKMRTWANENNIGLNLEEATEEWLDFWKSEGSLKADWMATWRNGMKSRQKRAQSHSNGKAPMASRFESETRFLIDAIRESNG